jgi:hypothetical protein
MRVSPASPRRRFSRRGLIISGASVVVGLIVLGALATTYTDLLWFRETGFTSVFWTQIRVKAALGAVFAAIFAALLLVNLYVVQKVTSPHRLFTLEDSVLERYRATLRPYVRAGVIAGAVVLGLFAGSGATSQWRSWLLYGHSAPFPATDPVFHKNLAFYVFRLPFLRFVFTWTFSTLIVITLITAVAHYLVGGIRFDQRGGRATPQVKVHISVLLGFLVLLKAWGYRLDQFGLLYSPRGTVTGASYTDVNAQLPALRLLVIMAILVGIIFFVNIRVRGWAIPVAGIGLLLLTSILAGGAYPALVQRLRVTPVERIREQPFIKRNIEFTRAAYGISDATVNVQGFPGDTSVTKAMIARNQPTIQNIRLWSPDVLAKAYVQLQRIRQYYEFADVDVDRYTIGGQERQVMLSAREMSQDSLQPGAKSWLNTHLVYTHGNGVVASRVDKVTPQGQPDFIVENVPPVATEGMPTPADARIYFGEVQDTRYMIVRSGVDELDFPQGSTFQGNRYEGKGGVQVSGALRRWAFAWRFRDANLLLSSAIKGDSRLLFRRGVQERIREVAPFLKLDHDPYIVATSGHLVWVQDAYTTTNMYPYSQRSDFGTITGPFAVTGTANYIRNSVKATVDAADGTITLYVMDPSDPIIRAWQKIFPGSFKPADAVPPELRAHFRYPEDLFRIQSVLYTNYHITDANDFYSKEDAWDLPIDPTNTSQFLPAYYVLMKLPGEQKETYILFTQFTPNGRKNLTAWLAAKSDPDGYGKLFAFTLPKQRNALGPEQVEAQIKQDPQVSQAQTLLGARGAGSEFVYGNMLTIPIEKSLLYVQPIYLASEGTQIPELKRVVVVAGGEVSLGATLADALAGLTGEAPPPGPGEQPPEATLADLISSALSHYAKAQEALKKGDFATYGREQAAMKADLDRAATASGATPSPSPSATASPR